MGNERKKTPFANRSKETQVVESQEEPETEYSEEELATMEERIQEIRLAKAIKNHRRSRNFSRYLPIISLAALLVGGYASLSYFKARYRETHPPETGVTATPDASAATGLIGYLLQKNATQQAEFPKTPAPTSTATIPPQIENTPLIDPLQNLANLIKTPLPTQPPEPTSTPELFSTPDPYIHYTCSDGSKVDIPVGTVILNPCQTDQQPAQPQIIIQQVSPPESAPQPVARFSEPQPQAAPPPPEPVQATEPLPTDPPPTPEPPVDLSALPTFGCLNPNSNGVSAEVGGVSDGYSTVAVSNNSGFKTGFDEETGQLNEVGYKKNTPDSQGRINLSEIIEQVVNPDGELIAMTFNPQQEYYLMLQRSAFPDTWDGPKILIYDICADPNPTPEPTSVAVAIATATSTPVPTATLVPDEILELRKVDPSKRIDDQSILIGARNCQTLKEQLVLYWRKMVKYGTNANLPNYGQVDVDTETKILLAEQLTTGDYQTLAGQYEKTHPVVNTMVCK